MKCNVCKETISDSFYTHPFFGDTACLDCIGVNESICRWCGRFKSVSILFGEKVCQTCESTLVATESDLELLVSRTLQIVERHIGPNSYHLLPVRFGELSPSWYAPNPSGNAFMGSVDPHIRIQKGMPLGVAIGTLAHEYGHMMLNHDYRTLDMRPGFGARIKPGPDTRELMIEEGFCEVVNAVALLSQTSDDARWQSFLLPGNPSPIYGDGFRMMWPRALELGSVAALLEELTGERHDFRGPVPNEAIDEFEEPRDLAPLVDASSSDRHKGVLRGTALLLKDLPKDAPVGPRLRGRGLSGAEKDKKTIGPSVPPGTLRGTGLSTPDRPTVSAPKRGALRGRGLNKK